MFEPEIREAVREWVQLYSEKLSVCALHQYYYRDHNKVSRYSDTLRAGRSGDRIQVEKKFSTHVQKGPGTEPSILYNGYRVFPGGKAVGVWH